MFKSTSFNLVCRNYSTVNYNSKIIELINNNDCFYILVFKSNKHKLGEGVSLSFVVNSPDKFLLNELSKILGVSSANIVVRKTCYSFTVKDFKTITEKVIPFFEMYPLVGIKQNDFLDWCKVAKLMSNKSHLTIEGLNLIRTIKGGMNKGRPKE